MRSAVGLVSTFENWPTTLVDHLGLAHAPYVCRLRNGLRLRVRPGTDDRRIVFDTFVKQCYAPVTITSGSVVLDIGAHIGCFSLLAARLGAHVHAFEPHPANLALLTENLRLNGCETAQVSDWAVAGKRGTRALYLPDHEGHVARFSLHPGRGTRTIRVDCTTLDTVLADVSAPEVSCLKLDCQGAEYEILYAASAESLGRVREIIVECEPFDDRTGWSLPALRHYLEGRGFGTHAYGNLLHAARPPGVIQLPG